MIRVLAILLVLPIAAPAQLPESPRTQIRSERLSMQGGDTHNLFRFEGSVEVADPNLQLTCDLLLVKASRSGGSEEATIGEAGAIESILAEGNVVIVQGGRTAYAERAELLPRGGTVILSGNPRIVDEQAEVRGWKIILRRGARTAEVIPAPEGEDPGSTPRPTVILNDAAFLQLPDPSATEEDSEGGD